MFTVVTGKSDDQTMFSLSLVWLACEAGDLAGVETLFSLGADLNTQAVTDAGLGVSCLNIAAEKGHQDVVQFLLDNNAKVKQDFFLS